ncbi:MAG: hypothetical protein HFE43_09935 [Oscillospiraceae bacterium]|nr:hypothetical protein [Oscillospiraceae bacterium]
MKFHCCWIGTGFLLSALQAALIHPFRFFLYEKSVLRESDCLRGRGEEVCTDLTPTPFPPLKITGSKGI